MVYFAQTPNESERGDMLQGLLETYHVSPDISVSHLAQRTAVSIILTITVIGSSLSTAVKKLEINLERFRVEKKNLHFYMHIHSGKVTFSISI